MTFKIFAGAMVACSVCFVLVMIYWQRMILSNKEQELATRVARALHDLGGSATAKEIRRRIYRDGGPLEALEDVRWNLRLMQAEGTVRVRYVDQPAGDASIKAEPLYTLTPRTAPQE
jgi:hypothetical protein